MARSAASTLALDAQLPPPGVGCSSAPAATINVRDLLLLRLVLRCFDLRHPRAWPLRRGSTLLQPAPLPAPARLRPCVELSSPRTRAGTGPPQLCSNRSCGSAPLPRPPATGLRPPPLVASSPTSCSGPPPVLPRSIVAHPFLSVQLARLRTRGAWRAPSPPCGARAWPRPSVRPRRLEAHSVRLHSAPVSSAFPCRLASPCRTGRIFRIRPRRL